MVSPLDPKRIAELQELMGPTYASILRSLEQSIAGAIDEADGAVAAGDLARAAYVAHRCRNDALMVGASQLQEALTALESATRAGDLDGSRTAITRVRRLWSGARRELARVAQRDCSA